MVVESSELDDPASHDPRCSDGPWGLTVVLAWYVLIHACYIPQYKPCSAIGKRKACGECKYVRYCVSTRFEGRGHHVCTDKVSVVAARWLLRRVRPVNVLNGEFINRFAGRCTLPWSMLPYGAR